MMLPLMLAQAAVAPAAPPAAYDEVTVIGQRLKKWQGKVSTTFGITTCRTTTSTGDKELDAVGCTALKTCWSPAIPRYKEVQDKKLPAETRRTIFAQTDADLGQCLRTRRDALVDELVARRAAARDTGA